MSFVRVEPAILKTGNTTLMFFFLFNLTVASCIKPCCILVNVFKIVNHLFASLDAIFC